MRAALMESYGDPLPIREVADPPCPPDGVVLTVQACGVCRSDHHNWVGKGATKVLPHVMGHEFAGLVEEVGPQCKGYRIGDRVTAPFIASCGHCGDCRGGQATICATQHTIGFSIWGAFAERVAVPHADFNLVALPEGLDVAQAAGIGCRVTTAWRALTDRARLQPGEWVAVHGSGGVGLSCIMIAAALGARVLAIDINEAALAKAKEMGANAVLDARQAPDVGEAVREMTGGGAHVAIEGLGTEVTFENALRSLRKLGRHIQIGMPVGQHATVALPLLELIYLRQLSIHGMRGLGAPAFTDLLAMVEAGRLDMGPLVTRRIALSGAGAALAEMDHGAPAGVTVIDDFRS